MSKGLERICKEVVLAKLMVLLCHLSVETEKNRENSAEI
jgi:hypothetical protein